MSKFQFLKSTGILSISLILSLTSAALSESLDQTDVDELAETEIAAAGILPVPVYDADVQDRAFLFGDLGGKRTKWANNGIQFNVESLSWTDTVVDGGVDDDTQVGSLLAYNLNFDLMRAGILPGALISVRAETRFGESGNVKAGRVSPMNTAALSPTNYSAPDDGYDFALTNLTYLQMLSEHFGLIVGKFDMYGDGQANEFSTGRGHTTFQNWSFNSVTPTILIPASTVGVGAVFLPNPNLNVTALVTSATECTKSNCFDDLDDGGIALVKASYQYNMNGLPGGVNGFASYTFDADFTELDSLSFSPREGFSTSTKSSMWIASMDFWQYLWTKELHTGPVNLINREADLRGVGVFGSLAFADKDVNPYKTSGTIGVGGRGIFDARPDDTFGVGYFYNDLAKGRFLDKVNDGQGAEAFYNFAITPAVRLTAGGQWIKSAGGKLDDAVVLSTRLQVTF